MTKRLGGTAPAVLDARTTFLTGLRAYIVDEPALRRVLQPLAHGDGSGVGTGVLTESLAKVLLGVDDLQSEAVTVLLEKMCEYFLDTDAVAMYVACVLRARRPSRPPARLTTKIGPRGDTPGRTRRACRA